MLYQLLCFLLEQKQGFVELRRQESLNKLDQVLPREDSNANSDDEMEEVTAVSVENDIELEEMVENGKRILMNQTIVEARNGESE